MASNCTKCGAFSGTASKCIEHMSIVSHKICNICYRANSSNSVSDFVCNPCYSKFCVWLIWQKRHKYIPFFNIDFLGFVTFDGINTYYSKPDLSMINIDWEQLADNVSDVDKIFNILSNCGIDMTDRIQIRINKVKSTKSNISFIEK